MQAKYVTIFIYRLVSPQAISTFVVSNNLPQWNIWQKSSTIFKHMFL